MTNKPTICVECEHVRESIPENICAIGAEERINYVTGIPYFIDFEICCRKNHEGNCPDFETKRDEDWSAPDIKGDYLIPSGIPPSPPPMREGPPVWVHADGYLGPECPICRSDIKRRWWIVGPLLGCINEDCRNYWKRRGVTPPNPWPPAPSPPAPKE